VTDRHRPKPLVGLRQFVKGPLRFQLALLQQEDGVAGFHRAEAMRNQDNGDFMPQVVYRFHHCLFGEVVQCAGGFIQNQHLRVVIQRSGNADALALPAREARSLTSHGLERLRCHQLAKA